MKITLPKQFLLVLILLQPLLTFSQAEWDYEYNFEDTTYIPYLEIVVDPIHFNSWKVGSPEKSIFTSGLSAPNVIVTDTANTYPINDSSVFILTHYPDMEFVRCLPVVFFSGSYWVDSDFGADYGKMEVSPNNGQTWIDLLDDANLGVYFQWYSNKPVLTGSSNGWVDFMVDLSDLYYYNPEFGWNVDTLLYRFTFISDSIDTQKDGLTFDNLHFFSDDGMGISENPGEQWLELYPNPASQSVQLKIDPKLTIKSIQIHELSGKEVEVLRIGNSELDISSLHPGIYIIQLESISGVIVKSRFIKH